MTLQIPRPRLRRARWAALAAAIGIALAGCGQSGGGAAPGTDPVVTVPLAAPLAVINPIMDTAAGGAVYSSMFQSMVFNQDPAGPVPALAESWETAPDGMTWTFHLDPDAKFHDGTPVTADDVVFTLTQEKEPANPHAGTLGILDRAEAVDPHTVVLHLTKPNSALVAIIGAKYILPKDYYERVGPAGFSAAPIGSGPFKFVKAIDGGGVELARVDAWHGPEQPLAGIRFKPVTSSQAQVAGLQTGELNIVPDLPTSQADRLAAMDGIEVVETGGAPVSFIAFDVRSGPGQDRDFREAVNLAIDKDALVKTVMQGHAQPAASLITPPVVGHDPTRRPTPYDPERAKQLLARSSYDGSPIPFTYPTSVLVNADEMAKAVANYLSAVGIAVQPIPIDYSTFLQQWAAKQITGMYMMQYKNGTDADTIITSLYARGTRVLFDDPEVFATVDRTREATGEERLAALAELEQLVLDKNRYYAPLLVPNAVYGVTDGIPLNANPFNPILVAWK